jgi:hypothetical protein
VALESGAPHRRSISKTVTPVPLVNPNKGAQRWALTTRTRTRSLATTSRRLGGGGFGLFGFRALNVSPHAIVAHSHLVACGVAFFGGFGAVRRLWASHLGSIPSGASILGWSIAADATRRVNTASRLPSFAKMVMKHPSRQCGQPTELACAWLAPLSSTLHGHIGMTKESDRRVEGSG